MSDERSARSGSMWLRLAPALLLVVAVAAVLIWTQTDLFRGGRDSGTVPAEEPAPDVVGGVGAEPEPPETANGPLERRWLEATGMPPEWPGDFDRPAACDAVVSDLRLLCERLDSREYVRSWDLADGTFGLITGLSGDLERRRPVVEGELRRHEAILTNVSHLFRVLGERRVKRLAEILAREPDLAEPLAMSLFRWGRVRERCDDSAARAMPFKAQYDYAAFLVSTIGGQAYLRRRVPRLESLASFYALLVLDRAVEDRYNPAGVDLRKEIARCKLLMRGQDVLFRDRYIGILEEMERRWTSRSSLVSPRAAGN